MSEKPLDTPTPPPAPAPAPSASTIPDGLPEQFWDATSSAVNFPELTKSYGELAGFKKEHDDRIAALPQKPEDYKFEIKWPDGTKVPEQLADYKIDDKDPRVQAFRAFALERKMSLEDANALVMLDATSQVEAYNAELATIQEEQKKLGSNGPARISALETFLKANVAEEGYEALRGSALTSAAAFEALEKIIAKATTQAIPSNNGDPPPPPVPPKPSRVDVFYPRKAS